MARHDRLTPQIQQRIVEALNAGNYRHVAAAYGGIGLSTFHRWLAQGAAQKRGRFRAFREAIEEAETNAQVRLVAVVATNAISDPRLALEMMSRRWPREWGKSDRMALTVAQTPPLDALPDEELDSAIAQRLEEIERARHRQIERREPLTLGGSEESEHGSGD